MGACIAALEIQLNTHRICLAKNKQTNKTGKKNQNTTKQNKNGNTNCVSKYDSVS